MEAIFFVLIGWVLFIPAVLTQWFTVFAASLSP